MIIDKLNSALNKTDIIFSKYVYIYSDFRAFLNQAGRNPEKKVLKFLNFFTDKGITCITPAFSYTTTGSFNLRKTSSRVGFLSNFILKNCKHERSNHPIFSYIALGKNKKILKNLGKSAFGKKSLHETLINKNCFFLHLNRPLIKGNTMMHHIEQKNQIKYRFEKTFRTKVFDRNNYMGTNFKAFVRKDMINKYSLGTFKKAYKKLKNSKYINKKRIKDLDITIYPYDIFYKDMDNLLKKNKKIFILGKN